jgi:hypothetical protein
MHQIGIGTGKIKNEIDYLAHGTAPLICKK